MPNEEKLVKENLVYEQNFRLRKSLRLQFCKESVARIKADTSGNIKFGASDPKDAYSKLVPNLVFANTTDFRSRYEYRKVK